MTTISISENEYNLLQQKIINLEKKVELLQEQQFIQKLNLAYQIFYESTFYKSISYTFPEQRISMKRGAGKDIVTYMADDFDDPLDDIKDYN